MKMFRGLQLVKKALLQGVPLPTGDGIKLNHVISGGVYLGNDTSHDRQGDFFARNRALSVMQSFCRKRPLAFFDKPKEPLHKQRFF